MGEIKRRETVKLIAGLIAKDPGLFDKARNVLEKAFGRIDYESPVLAFDHTDYYADEMGTGLKRVFYGFERPVSLNNIHRAKIRTNHIERRLSVRGKRTVNIDPGYLDLSKVVLFSTKDYSHRIYLADGIFAEATLVFRNSSYGPWPWTYPDYRTSAYIEAFNRMRELYKKRKRSGR